MVSLKYLTSRPRNLHLNKIYTTAYQSCRPHKYHIYTSIHNTSNSFILLYWQEKSTMVSLRHHTKYPRNSNLLKIYTTAYQSCRPHVSTSTPSLVTPATASSSCIDKKSTKVSPRYTSFRQPLKPGISAVSSSGKAARCHMKNIH